MAALAPMAHHLSCVSLAASIDPLVIYRALVTTIAPVLAPHLHTLCLSGQAILIEVASEGFSSRQQGWAALINAFPRLKTLALHWSSDDEVW